MNNQKIAKPIVIAAILVFSVLLAPISATVYDFTDTTNNKAYEGTDDSLPASAPMVYEAELNTSEYEQISTSNGLSAWYSGFNYDFHRFLFKINECIESINQIEVFYKGYGIKYAACGVGLYVWNNTISDWEFIESNSSCSYTEINKIYTSVFSNYINETGYLLLLAQTTATGPSCPFLYVWDGSGYHFVTDTNNDGKISTSSRQPWPEDYVKIDGSELTAENGAYRLELAEDQDEITYLDSVRLLAVDHQPGIELYATRRIRNPNCSNVLPYTLTIMDPRVPVSATDERGRDVLPRISAVDRQYTEAHKNYLDSVTVDFGDLSGAPKIKLLYNAYCDWSDTGSSERRENDRPYVEVINEAGEWERVSDDEHFRNANPKPITTVLDITDWFRTDDYRIRINNWREVHIDYIAVDTSEDEAVAVTEVPLAAANLYWKGVSVQSSPDGHQPLIPDFYTTVGLSGFRAWTGKFTKYGDVLPLVTAKDDKFVIMHAGDSVSLAFDELPVPAGMDRDYYLISDAYFKSKGNSVDPLPFHSMSEHPYPESESYPNDAEHQAYLAEYNTREFGSISGEEGHHTIYTDYVSVEITTKPIALEVNKTVWDPVNETWVKELTAKMNDTLQFKSTITNTGEVNLTNVRFWDILDCSLNYSGNATLTNASGGKMDIMLPPTHCFKPKVLHPRSSPWLNEPISATFTELCPEFGHLRTLTDWYDTDEDKNVSVCDQVQLTSITYWYHVDRLPYTLNLSNANGTTYFDSVRNWNEVALSDPNQTKWLEVCCCKDSYSITAWYDTNSSGDLNVGDTIIVQNERTGEEVQYTIEEVAIDLVVSREYEMGDYSCQFIILEPTQTITIEYNATVVRCGVDNNTFVAKGKWCGENWIYSDPDVVTITVPCPVGDAADDTPAIKDLFTAGEDVYALAHHFAPNKNVSIYITPVRTWAYGDDIATHAKVGPINTTTDANGSIGINPKVLVWPNSEPGLYHMVFDDPDGIFEPGVDIYDLFEVSGRAAVPLITPLGIIALIGLLGLIATSRLVRKRKN